MNKDEVVQLLQDLIRIPSFVSENNLVDYIESWLKQNTKLDIIRQPLSGGRFNLLAKNGEPNTIFLAHTDTVQPSVSAKINQLEGKIIKNEIWGRGATDMKSGIAVLMSAAHLVKDAKNYWIMFYADEEHDFLGMKALVKEYGHLRPKRLVSADGSDLKVGHGCRGLIELTCRIRGEVGHPAKETGNSAIWGTVQVLNKLRANLENQATFNLAYIHGGTEIPQSIGPDNRLNEVGKAGNVVSDICEFTLDIRPSFSRINVQSIISQLQKEFNFCKLKFELVEQKHNLGAWNTNPADLADLGNVDFADINSTGYLDLQMLWEATGKPTSFMFGGGIGSTAHKPDERIKISDLIKTRDFFKKVFENLPS